MIAIMEGYKTNYTTAEYNVHTPVMGKGDIMAQEMEGERKAAMVIVKMLRNGLKIADAAVELGEGSWWDRGPPCNIAEILTKLTPQTD
jgi:hypothetical protein